MWTDAIVEEVREMRVKLLAECGGELMRVFDRVADLEKQHPELVISREQFRRTHPRRGVASAAGKPVPSASEADTEGKRPKPVAGSDR
ncbi:MAG TPA: hypothetical protein VGP72_25810 [Planctomycetota bacterium]